MKQVKNLTALIMTVLLVFSMVAVVPVTVSAADDEPVEPTEFEEISTVEDLYMINFDLAGNYKLMNDIDLTEDTAQGGDWDYVGNGWEPIGSGGAYKGGAFTGIFDGNGYEIKGMRINITKLPSGTSSDSYAGLFANNAGTIKNLTVSGEVKSSVYILYVGAICGYNSGTMENCANKCNIDYNTNSYNSQYVGGIAGWSTDKSGISCCYNNGSVKGAGLNTSSYYCVYVAGISNTAGQINDCYNTGNISATNKARSSYAYSAGISAYGSSNSKINNCYSIGTATKAIAYNSVTNCYFLGGCGADTTGAKSLTNAQMKIERIYAGFDFDNVWVLDKNSEYPYPQLKNNRQTHSVVGIEISSLPDKVTYVEGEEFDNTGLEVVTVYENGTKKAIEDYQVSGFESVKGEQTVTVTFGEFSETFTVNVYELGDANLDGRINVRDVTAIQRHIADLEKIDDEQLAVADANGDGVVTIDDATLLQMFLAEYDVILGKE